jgi:hypothetical protein
MSHPKYRTRLLLACVATGAAIASMITPPAANAVPGQCGGGGFAGNGGSFCDTDAWADGSFWHQESVCVLGFCGANAFRACAVPGGRVPTDSDPATPC